MSDVQRYTPYSDGSMWPEPDGTWVEFAALERVRVEAWNAAIQDHIDIYQAILDTDGTWSEVSTGHVVDQLRSALIDAATPDLA